MLGIQGPHLGTAALEQPLAGQAAAGEGPEALGKVPPLIQTLGVDGGVKNHQNPILLVVLEKMGPGVGGGQAQSADSTQKPPQLHPAYKGHHQENKHKNQGHTGVPG